MQTDFRFTFDELEKQYIAAIDSGYKIVTCLDYATMEGASAPLLLINRVDVDFSMKKASVLC